LDCSNGFFFAVFNVVAKGIECILSAHGEQCCFYEKVAFRFAKSKKWCIVCTVTEQDVFQPVKSKGVSL
jgi:hypothetical protein